MTDDVASHAQEEASIAVRRFNALHALSQLVADAARRDAAMARLEAALRSHAAAGRGMSAPGTAAHR